MTSKAVTQAGFYRQNVTTGNQKTKQSGDTLGGFGFVMNKASSETASDTVSKASKPCLPEKNTAVNTGSNREIRNSETQRNVSEARTERQSDNESPAEAVGGKADEIRQAISDELGVSEEEIAKAMEALGMQMTDLLNPEMLTGLLLALSGESDMLSLITDGQLYASLQKVLNTLEGVLSALQGELSLSPQELSQLLSRMNQEEAQTVPDGFEQMDGMEALPEDETVQQGQVLEEPVTDAKTAAAVKASDVSGRNTAPVEKAEGKTAAENGSAGTAESNQSVTVTVSKSQEDASQNSNSMAGRNGKEETKESGDQTKTAMFDFAQNIANQAVQKMNAAAPAAGIPVQTADAEQIMRQVMNHLKMNISPQVTELAMQLHPESLGTIQLQVAYREGALTARFAAQNETVKAALEGQMIQLRENLNEQGIKVEAIEVTVQSHEFERNLQQDSRGNENSAKSEKRGHRKINLNAMDAIEETDMDEADQIAVRIMEQNGNSVDFTA